jgi:type IV secretion system protein TrbE
MVSLSEIFTKPRSAVASLTQLLPWFKLVAPGVVLCNDGSLLVGYRYFASDLEGVVDDDLNARIDMFERALRQLNDRITLISVQDRFYETSYPDAPFQNTFAKMLDAQWQAQVTQTQHAQMRHTLYLQFAYPNKSEAFFEQLVAEMQDADNVARAFANVVKNRLSERSALNAVKGLLADMVSEFAAITGNFEGIAQQALGFQRMSDEDLLGALYRHANPTQQSGPVSVNTSPLRDGSGLRIQNSTLSVALGSDQITRRNDLLRFDGITKTIHCVALSLTALPSSVSSVHIDRLVGVPAEFTMVQTFQVLDQNETEKIIQNAEAFYRTEVKSVAVRLFEQFSGQESQKVNHGMGVLADDAQDALIKQTSDGLSFGYYNMTILVRGNSERDAADRVASALKTNGYAIIRERQGLLSAYMGSLPGGHRSLMRKYLCSVDNVADLVPLRTILPGVDNHPYFSEVLGRPVAPLIKYMTMWGTAYNMNLHVDDVGHALVIGGTGSGKSTKLSLFLAQYTKYYPCQAFIFDKDFSLYAMSKLLGGKSIDLTGKSGTQVRANPVKRMLSATNGIMALNRWMCVLIGASGHQLTPDERNLLSDTITQLAQMPSTSHRLSVLFALISGRNPDLASKFRQYVDLSDPERGSIMKGVYADFFDNDDDDFQLSNIVCMETGELLQTPEIASPFMEYAFFCIKQRLDRSVPTLIIVEECWYMLANAEFEAGVDEWLRTFRKNSGQVVFATQSPEELQRMRSWAAFVVNVPTRIFLPSINQSVMQLAPIYKQLFSMNDAMLELLKSAVPKRDYLILQPGATRLVTSEMPKVIIDINKATATRSLRESIANLSESGDPEWQWRFLEESLGYEIQ